MRFSFGWLGVVARASLVAATAFVAACGSGAVSGPASTAPGAPISVTPPSATMYSDAPTTFLVTGGNGNYIVLSSDQNALPVAGSFSGNSISLVPSQVASDTNVTLTFRDTVGSQAATVSVVVKPRTIANTVTVTPSASQSAACGTSVCAGGDAEVKVVLSQGGVPLTNRAVRFDVVSGDIRIITSPAGTPEQLSLSGTTTSDNTGTARMRIRVLPDATSQTALLQVTDVSSGFTQRTSVPVAASSNAPLSALPSVVQFTGPDSNTCASGISADVIIFGGRPPYQISQPAAFTVTPSVVTNSGAHFTVTSTGQCAEQQFVSANGSSTTFGGQVIAIVDANGASASITVYNNRAPTVSVTVPFAVAPSAVNLDSCNAIATVALVGGGGQYFAASGSNALRVDVGTNAATIRRQSGTSATASPINVAFSDGKTVQQVAVTLSSTGLGTCP